ncbi:MAG: hypothetical protein COT81_05180 [Candidatus Buchananbacteria bacterium CG10_big_fil_rev_8_21_14_0_10_42_9]|uniref:Uncharacterized protein n=1 Tax=Candidatus Buchananbacteria bacterium CG10_big_fil_rev_8_21_14_0_10_42_9 TaxID=1974526 RepID=A0A2H0W019_9BACT|nr:MAG: hypothetical protein COT81_05180 [Candidatus Buchananbacteria bacterium CG10_big_fil_rev_8_21_14_0_10_42_9]
MGLNKEDKKPKNAGQNPWQILALGLLFMIVFSWYFDIDIKPRLTSKTSDSKGQINSASENTSNDQAVAINEEMVLPSQGVTLPVVWGDLGKQLVDKGVIDKAKFEAVYARRGGMTDYEKALLESEKNANLKIDQNNAQFILNLLWAFGLANKNPILETGPMQSEQYGGAGRFASTGGWSLARGGAMDHYSQYGLVELNAKQQDLVEEVSQNIYRPCCGNSTYFPDCNHGMAMLGLLELLAAQGATEAQMYKAALQVNSFWFPDTYLTLAQYFQKRGLVWDKVDAKVALSSSYSSSSGYQQVRSEVKPVQRSSGGGCGV